MSVEELYVKDAEVWIRDPETVWKRATVKSALKDGKLTVIHGDSPQELVIDLSISGTELPPLCNPEILIGENDLTSLSYLHEPAVLHNLKVRFCNSYQIYTYCGIVLVAINPYKSLPLYSNDVVQAYSGQDFFSMDPHVFAVAEEAYKSLSIEEKNQSVIISGESGAGKTVSAKYVMRYLAAVTSDWKDAASDHHKETQIEQRVLASNPIMEAIGNAKTTRNDNSSRFGKYIEILFNQKHTIIGANMRTYLLEKSRVTFQASEERNYHIFYQLCASKDLPEFCELYLGSSEDFEFTNQGNCHQINNVNDMEELENTREAMQTLGINEQTQLEIFQILSAILHLGNLNLVDDGNEGSKISDSNNHMKKACELLGIDLEQTAMWLVYRKIQTMNEIMTKPLNCQDSLNSRNALCRHIYANLFNWIVDQVNKMLSPNIKSSQFIGVLDIYGFETFKVNSFEQFCINYANEKLQQQFTQHVFKLEQEEYVKEEISWSFIEFYDNQPCIELIEGKMGILSLLDEECKMPKGADSSWCQKLYNNHLKKSQNFDKPRMSQKSFIIKHFADNVEYECNGFLGKNKDTVIEEHVNLLKASTFQLVADIFQEKPEPAAAAAAKPLASKVTRVSPMGQKGNKNLKKTVGGQFKDSLKQLMDSLNSTTPHYIRCIKPNDSKTAFEFDNKRAVQQLRACGVLETIRISAAGFPSRWSYAEFFKRYRVLMHSDDITRNDVHKTCEFVLNKYISDADKFQFGKTKIFFRAGQVAYLEKLRKDKLKAACIMMQKCLRCFVERRKFVIKRKSAITAQKVIRGFLARRKVLHLRQNMAAIKIQKNIRSHLQRKKYLNTLRAVIKVQCFARQIAAKREFTRRLRNTKAVVIQKYYRKWSAMRSYARWRRGIIMAQCCTRRLAARKQFKALKVQARSVDHLKQLNKGMENKIFSLQSKLNSVSGEKAQLAAQIKSQQTMIESLNSRLDIFQTSQGDAKAVTERLNAVEAENVKLTSLVDSLKMEKGTLEELMCSKDARIAELESSNKDLGEKVQSLTEQIETAKSRANEISMKEAEWDKKESETELASTRARYQKLLNDYSRLEQRYENLQDEAKYLMKQSGVKTYTGSFEETHEDELSESGRLKDVAEDGDESSNAAVVIRLNNRIRELELEKAQLEERAESGAKDAQSPNVVTKIVENPQDALIKEKLKEVSADNEKLRGEISRLAKLLESGDQGDAIKEVNKINSEMSHELTLKNEEISRLKSEMAEAAARRQMAVACSTMTDLPTTASADSAPPSAEVNEDGEEMLMAYQSAKDTNRLLEAQLQAMQKNYKLQEKELRSELSKQKQEIEKQQKIISEYSRLTARERIEQTYQIEINRLTSDNLDLRAVIDSQDKIIKKLRKQTKQKTGSDDDQTSHKSSDHGSPVAGRHAMANSAGAAGSGTSLANSAGAGGGKTYQGMLAYNKSDEPSLIRNLIIELKPIVAATMMPCIPAYVLLMCIRHCDYLNDDFRVRSLLHNAINGIKKAIKKRYDDAECVTLWLSNSVTLLHLLKQYSGEEVYMSRNSDQQNEQCLRNFDLTEYRNIINDLAIQIYQNLVRILDNKLQPMIVSGMLEHEGLNKLTMSNSRTIMGINNPANKRQAAAAAGPSDNKTQFTLDSILKQLSIFLNVLSRHSLDFDVVKQLFKQVFYILVSSTVNNLLLRREMCHWSKGMQIRYNISEMEEWLRNHKLADCGTLDQLEALVQISQLLQVGKKTDEDAANIINMCSKLTPPQIIKILNLYTPVNDYEDKVSVDFIKKVEDRLKSSQPPGVQSSLLMDSKHLYPITFPYHPSQVALETVTIPENLSLAFLKRV